MALAPFTPFLRHGPLFEPSGYADAKDPCPVFDGTLWHAFGSRGAIREERWRILHATAPDLAGPWTEQAPAGIAGMEGERLAAPGVVFDPEDGLFHMFLHADFLEAGKGVEHLVSRDGASFAVRDTAVSAAPERGETGVYDPHPAAIGTERYLAYASTPAITRVGEGYRSEPDLYLARSVSGTWDGPWERLGRILDQDHVAHHNRKDDPAYEWGLEGPQLIGLPGGLVLLNATCFVPGGRMGTRQRVFFAAARSATGPYVSLGLALDAASGGPWESGENGHAAGIIIGDELHLLYQGRHADNADHRDNPWRFGRAAWKVGDIERAAEAALRDAA